jgi:hypothetical protein
MRVGPSLTSLRAPEGKSRRNQDVPSLLQPDLLQQRREARVDGIFSGRDWIETRVRSQPLAEQRFGRSQGGFLIAASSASSGSRLAKDE